MSTPALLRRWELFAHFTDQQLDLLAPCVSRQRLAAGATILKEGEPTLDAYLIESGEVRIQRQTPYGSFSLATLEPGDLFGETSFVDKSARSGDAVAVAGTELLTLSPTALAAAMDSDPRLTMALHWTFWKSLSKKLRQTNEKLTQFFSETGKPATTQTAAALESSGEFRIDLASKRKLFQEQKLSNLEINFLTSLSKERKFPQNKIIFREGEIGDEMFVVLEGRVMISKYIPGAGEEALAFLERGDYFGEMALIDNQPRSADAKAHEGGAVVLSIPREVLNGILDIHKVSSLRLLKILCNLVATRLRELDDKIIGWFILAGGSGPSGGGPAERES
ncbi:MAG TPA: cyclic nucleotide-binding domain-containing protein [Thermoanaerobaculia bacterium]|nr:cyclic nucleotide-binding domain-containing protein [Thermoanaerobaculia bacterium]